MATSELMGLTFSAAQWRAVAAPPGPILVLAGPGAGKTRCLTGRIAFLLHSGVEPHRLCALTFTNKAAQEIAERLRHGLGDAVEQMTLGTIHALCLRILRRQGHGVGLPSGFGVADEEHQRLVLGRLGVPTRRHRNLLTQFGRRRQDHSLAEPDEKLFWAYNRELRSNHLIDFDEILSLTHKLLESSAVSRAVWQSTWDHLLIDEFQDLDKTQYAILRSLAQEHRSLFAVGDDEQSIFSWRGAAPRLMKHFVEDFAIDAPIILDANHRCSTAIFETARRILPLAEPLFVKSITAQRESSYPVRAAGCADEKAETAWIVSDLQADLRASGLRRGEYAILYRTHQIGQLFEEALLKAGIPCQLAKGQSLSDDPIIAQLLASLRIVADPEADLHVEYLAGKVLSESLLLDVRRQPGETLLDRLRVHAEQSSADAARAWRFLYQVENLKALRQFQGDLPALIEAVFAQGIGQLDSPLEKCRGHLSDPECLPLAQALAEQMLHVAAHGGRVLLPPAGGLEIPIKVMIRRALPQLSVEYLHSAQSITANDAMLTLDCSSDRLRIVEIFKALQAIEGRRYRKSFDAYVAFDTETTGLNIEHCEVIELAAAKVCGGRAIDTFHSLVRAARPISPGAGAVHGYTDADLRNQPSLREVWPRFRTFVGDHVLVAHNGHRFDIPLLERLTAAWQGTRGLTFFDTLPLARNLFPTARLRLDGLASRFGVAHRPNHHALDDSLCLVQVFEHLQEERLRRLRKTCLANLLDCVALGAAIEDRQPTCPEDVAVLEAGSWRELRRPPEIVNVYSEEAERCGSSCPPLQTLLTQLLGEDGWRGGRGEPTLRDRYPESHARLSRLLALVEPATLEESIRQLLDRTALSRSDGTGIDRNRVSLLTFHATKGLEFSRVYIAGVEDGQLPGPYAFDEGRDEMHEARRLLYVAMTRAKDRLTLTWSKQRRGEPTGGTSFLDALGLTQPARSASKGER